MTYSDYINGTIKNLVSVSSGSETKKTQALFTVPADTPFSAEWLIKYSIIEFDGANTTFVWPTNDEITSALHASSIVMTDGLIVQFILVNTSADSIYLNIPPSNFIFDPTGAFTTTNEMKSNEVRTYKFVSVILNNSQIVYSGFLVSGNNVATQFEYSPDSGNYSLRNLDYVGTANNGPFLSTIGGLATSNSRLGITSVSYDLSSGPGIILSIIDGSSGLFNELGASGVNELIYFQSIGATGASGINQIVNDYGVNSTDVNNFFHNNTNTESISSFTLSNENLNIKLNQIIPNESAEWNFNKDCTLTFPDETQQSTAFVGLNQDLNTVVGTNAFFGSTGISNTVVGYNAFNNNLGSNNTVYGYEAMFNGADGNCGDNTAIGFSALANNTTGTNNTAIGSSTGVGGGFMIDNTSGSNNTMVGYRASSNNFSDCVVLGANASASNNNQFVVGSSTNNAGIINDQSNAVGGAQFWHVRINGINYVIPLYLSSYQ